MLLSNISTYIIRNKTQIFRFTIVGIVTFIINYILVWIFFDLLIFNYRIAVTFGFVITVIIHFILNKTYTYKSTDKIKIYHLGKYGLMLLINYGITITISIVTVELLGLSPYIGIIFATVVTAFSSFILMKYMVFSAWLTKDYLRLYRRIKKKISD